MPRVSKSPKSPAKGPAKGPVGSPGESPASSSGEGERLSMFDVSGDSRIRVMRRDEKSMKFILHGYLPADSSEEDVATTFGGGHYRCQKIVKDAQGASVIESQREFDVPGQYKPPTGELPGLTQQQPQAAPAQAAISALPQVGTGNVMEILQSGLVGTVLDLLNKARQPASTDGGMAEVLREMARQASEDRRLLMETLKAMQGQGTSRAEVLAELQQMKNLVAPTSAMEGGRSQLTELVSAIKELREVSEEFTGGSKSEPTDPLSFVPQVLEVLTEEQRLKREAQAARRPRPPQPAITQGGAPVPPQPAQPAQPEAPLWQRVLVGEGPRLVQQAQLGTDPDDVAGLVVKFAPPQLRGAITEIMNGPTEDVVAKLKQFVPGLADYPTWTEEFVVAVQYELFGEPDDPTQEQLPLDPVPPVN